MNKSKNMINLINYADQLIKVLDSLKKTKNNNINKISKKLIEVCNNNNRKILVCGNGGSATDADHFVTELIVRFKNNKRKSIPAISLSSNSGLITAAGNDLGFENIFKRQLESLANKNDCVMFISTSGNSRNLIEAAKFAKTKNIYSIGLLGSGGGKLLKYCNTSYIVPSTSVARIQEIHIFLLHFFCELIDNSLLKNK